MHPPQRRVRDDTLHVSLMTSDALSRVCHWEQVFGIQGTVPWECACVRVRVPVHLYSMLMGVGDAGSDRGSPAAARCPPRPQTALDHKHLTDWCLRTRHQTTKSKLENKCAGNRRGNIQRPIEEQ